MYPQSDGHFPCPSGRTVHGLSFFREGDDLLVRLHKPEFEGDILALIHPEQLPMVVPPV